MSNNDDGSESIRKRLDVIIRLLMEEQVQSGILKRVEQLKLLHEIGLTSGEIGRILAQPSKDISSAIGKMKKRSAKKEK